MEKEETNSVDLKHSTYRELKELKENMEEIKGNSLSFSDVIDYLLNQEFKYDLLSKIEEKG